MNLEDICKKALNKVGQLMDNGANEYIKLTYNGEEGLIDLIERYWGIYERARGFLSEGGEDAEA